MKKKPTTTKARIQNQKQYQNVLMSLADSMEDPDFSLYPDEVIDAHIIKPVIGQIPTDNGNW